MGSKLRPRLCFLTKGKQGYGFHLHGERNRGGQLISKIEPGSCADLSGLRPDDRVVEVNGENVEQETHHQVSASTLFNSKRRVQEVQAREGASGYCERQSRKDELDDFSLIPRGHEVGRSMSCVM